LERFACLQFIVNFVLLLLLNTICAVLESKPVCLYLFVCYSVGSPLHIGADDTDKIGLNTWKGRKKDECRSRLFGTGPKEEEILVDHAEGRVYRSRNRPTA
jgi:hypothetical protein